MNMITRIRSFWCLLSLMAVSLLVLLVTSCSKDDDSDGKGSGSSVESKMVGAWLGTDKDDTNHFYLSLVLRADRSADYSQFYVDNSTYQSMIDQKGLKWAYKSSSNELTVYTSSTQGYVMKVQSFTGSSMVLSIKTKGGTSTNYYMDYLGSGGSGGGSSTTGGSSSGSTSGNKCVICGGSGKCSRPGYSDNKYYCQGSGVCARCNGSGRMDASFGLDKIRCTWCSQKVNESYGNGKCGYCGGTGKCHSCGGKGYK